MCLCYLFSAKTALQLVNRKADFFLQNESIRITNRIANWNALPDGLMNKGVAGRGDTGVRTPSSDQDHS